MLRLIRNLISWFVYAVISGLLLCAPLHDVGMRTISIICIALMVGFFAGLLNDIIRQLMIINNYVDYKPAGGHMVDTEHIFKLKACKALNFSQRVRVFYWILFDQKKRKHFVLCMVAHKYKPLDSYKETVFIDDNIMKDRLQRRYVHNLTYKKA